MALYLLSGVSSEMDELETIGRRTKSERKAARTQKKQTRQVKKTTKKATKQQKKVVRKDKRQAKKVVRKEKRATRKAQGKGLLKRVLRVPMAPARAAFLLGVKINALKLATKMLAAYRKDPAKTRTWWNKMGGDWPKLAQAISQGSKVKISGKQDLGSVAATLAAAAPIVVAVVKFFSEMGLFQGKEKEEYEKVAEDGIELLQQDPNVSETTAQMPEGSDGTAVLPKTDWLEKTQEGAELLNKIKDAVPQMRDAVENIQASSDYEYEETPPAPSPVPKSDSAGKDEPEDSGGMSTGTKVAIGVAVAAVVIGTGVALSKRSKRKK